MLANATDTADVEECRWVGGDEGMTPLTKQEKLSALGTCEAETPADNDRRARVEVKRRDLHSMEAERPLVTMPEQCLVGKYARSVVYYVAGWTLHSLSLARTITRNMQPL